jgi:hypothetical protein
VFTESVETNVDCSWHDFTVMANQNGYENAAANLYEMLIPPGSEMVKTIVFGRSGIFVIRFDDMGYNPISWVWSDNKVDTKLLQCWAEYTQLNFGTKAWSDYLAMPNNKRSKKAIAMMAEVYSDPRCVYVHFGNRDSSRLATIDRLCRGHASWQLTCTEWHKRIWTYQETQLPKELVYWHYGFKKVWRSATMTNSMPLHVGQKMTRHSIDFITLRLLTATRSATLPKDYIIGILALCSDVNIDDITEDGDLSTTLFVGKEIPGAIIGCDADGLGWDTMCWLPRGKIHNSDIDWQNKSLNVQPDGTVLVKFTSILPYDAIDLELTVDSDKDSELYLGSANHDEILFFVLGGDYNLNFTHGYWGTYDGDKVHVEKIMWVALKDGDIRVAKGGVFSVGVKTKGNVLSQ